jgi:hypothetical protein
MKLIVLVLQLIVACALARGEVFTHFSMSNSNNFFFAMDDRNVGACYEIRNSKEFHMIWETKGWYSAPGTVFLANDGQHLVRTYIVPANRKGKILPDEPAIEFYEKGTLLRRIKIKDIVDVEDLNVRPVNGLAFTGRLIFVPDLASLLSEKDWDNLTKRGDKNHIQYMFCEIVDGGVIVFDVRNGYIIFRGEGRKPRIEATDKEIFGKP